MEQNRIKEKVKNILSKPSYKFHTFNEDEMVIYAHIEPTADIAYYHRREKVDIMSDLSNEEIEYIFDKENDKFIIKE